MSDRRRRPSVEALEGRTLLAGSSSPTSPVPVHPEPITSPTPPQLGAAYHQILAIQASTLDGLSAAHRRLHAAYDEFAARANPAVARDRRILQQGTDLKASAERGLVVARGVADQAASSGKIDIPQHLFATLDAFVRQAQRTGSNLVRSANRATDAVIRKLDTLGGKLAGKGDPA